MKEHTDMPNRYRAHLLGISIRSRDQDKPKRIYRHALVELSYYGITEYFPCRTDLPAKSKPTNFDQKFCR